jgi:hypothetical protein
MDLRQCRCGSYPSLHLDTSEPEKLAQLKCSCGRCSAIVSFTKHEQAPKMIQALIDGWNLGEP